MRIPLEILKQAIAQGYVVSMWQKRTDNGTTLGFTCEMSRPAWAGSCCNTEETMRKAIKKTWKECQEVE
jgi:hypothetical protein